MTTTYLAREVDREGNMVSLIQSNYESFGSGLGLRERGLCSTARRAVHARPRVS